jgi:uncharacterized protein YbjQ (UPF0145 family)
MERPFSLSRSARGVALIEQHNGGLFFVVPLLVFGLLIGSNVERRHLRRLQESESERREMLITQSKLYPAAAISGPPPQMMVSEVVIASDYLKNFLASWRNIFGGEIRAYSRITDRAKREAVDRLVKQAQAAGFNAICNVRIQTVDIGGSLSKRKMAMAACVASGTAYRAGQR